MLKPQPDGISRRAAVFALRQFTNRPRPASVLQAVLQGNCPYNSPKDRTAKRVRSVTEDFSSSFSFCSLFAIFSARTIFRYAFFGGFTVFGYFSHKTFRGTFRIFRPRFLFGKRCNRRSHTRILKDVRNSSVPFFPPSTISIDRFR